MFPITRGIKTQEYCPEDPNTEREDGMGGPKMNRLGSIRNSECGSEGYGSLQGPLYLLILIQVSQAYIANCDFPSSFTIDWISASLAQHPRYFVFGEEFNGGTSG